MRPSVAAVVFFYRHTLSCAVCVGQAKIRSSFTSSGKQNVVLPAPGISHIVNSSLYSTEIDRVLGLKLKGQPTAK